MSNVDYEYQKAFSEVLTVIDASVLEVKNKIPKKIIDFFENNKLDNYIFELSDVELKKQNLSDISRCILTILYMDYICDEKSRIELKELYNEKQKICIDEFRNKNFIIQENMFFNQSNDLKNNIVNNMDNIEKSVDKKDMQLIKRNKFKEVIYKIIRKLRGLQ